MRRVRIIFRDGTERDFKELSYRGGYSLRHEGAFAIVTTEFGHEHHFPAETIAEVVTEPDRGAW